MCIFTVITATDCIVIRVYTVLGIGAIVGIALGGAALIALCLGFFLFCGESTILLIQLYL